jgi:TPR repeat protein
MTAVSRGGPLAIAVIMLCQGCSYLDAAMPSGLTSFIAKEPVTSNAKGLDAGYPGDVERGQRFLANGDAASAAREFYGPAVAGNPDAALALAGLFARGYGVTRDVERAGYWYEHAARSGLNKAQVAFARELWFGEYLAVDPSAALVWWEKAAAGGSVDANYFLGQVYLGGVQPAKAVKDMRHDPAKAASYFRDAANAGHVAAAACLARMYETGTGVRRDSAQAQYWYDRAGDRPSPDVALDISNFYGANTSPLHDQQKALFWMRRAAEAGNEEAIRRLNGMEHTASLAGDSLVLFGAPVATLERQTLRRALAARNVVVLDERDDAWFDVYESSSLWDQTDRLWIGYTLAAGRLATIRYRVPDGQMPAVLGRVRDELSARHGAAIRQTDQRPLDGIYAEWHHRDVTIRLARGDAGSLFVIYEIGAAFADMTREQGLHTTEYSGGTATWVTY